MTSMTAAKATGAGISIAPMGDPRQHRLAPACCCCFLWLGGLTFSSRDHCPNITLPVGGYFSFYYFHLGRGHDDFSNLPAFEEMLGSGLGWGYVCVMHSTTMCLTMCWGSGGTLMQEEVLILFLGAQQSHLCGG